MERSKKLKEKFERTTRVLHETDNKELADVLDFIEFKEAKLRKQNETKYPYMKKGSK